MKTLLTATTVLTLALGAGQAQATFGASQGGQRPGAGYAVMPDYSNQGFQYFGGQYAPGTTFHLAPLPAAPPVGYRQSLQGETMGQRLQQYFQQFHGQTPQGGSQPIGNGCGGCANPSGKSGPDGGGLGVRA